MEKILEFPEHSLWMRAYRACARFDGREVEEQLDLCALMRMYGVALRKATIIGGLVTFFVSLVLTAFYGLAVLLFGPAIKAAREGLPIEYMLTEYAFMYGAIGLLMVVAVILVGFGYAVRWVYYNSDIPVVWHVAWFLHAAGERIGVALLYIVAAPFLVVWKAGLFCYRFLFNPDALRGSPTFLQVASQWTHGRLHSICFSIRVTKTQPAG